MPAFAGAQEEGGPASRAQNSLSGSVGGFRLIDAGSGAPGTFRAQLHSEFFAGRSFLNSGDQNSRTGGALGLSWTPLPFLEAFASLSAYANSNDMEEPELLQTLGDLEIGVKGFYSVLPWLTVGGDLSFTFLNSVGDIGVVLGGTGVGLRGNVTADLRKFENKLPLIGRFNLQYAFDNSANLVDDIESRRYSSLVSPAPPQDETRHLLTRVERYALQINRTDFLNIGLGAEAPFEVIPGLVIAPLLEWTWSVPMNRQGYDCLIIEDTDPSAARDDGCLSREKISAHPMDITLGVRVEPPVEGLVLFAALDIGVTGTRTFVRELAPNEPYNFILGLGYAYDAIRRGQKPAEEPEEPQVLPAEKAEVDPRIAAHGRVTGSGRQPVAGAAIRFLGEHAGLTSLLANDAGEFTTSRLPEGRVDVEVSHSRHESSRCTLVVREGVLNRCELVPLPAEVSPPHSRVVRVTGRSGQGVSGARVTLSGAGAAKLQSKADGSVDIKALRSGRYKARVEHPNHLIKVFSFEVGENQRDDVLLELIEKPTKSEVNLTSKRIAVSRKIRFSNGSSHLTGGGEQVLAQVADLLIRHQDVHIQVRGHTDDRGSSLTNATLSQARADAVRQWLIDAGVDSGRLSAKGYGSTRPLRPNITTSNRARNRRVEFRVVRRDR